MKKETETSAPLFSENCPFNDLCGLEITERRGGHCTVACRTGENHLNPYGIVHGGLLFTMMDVAGGYAARTLDSGETIRCVTQNASTVFLHPGKPGTGSFFGTAPVQMMTSSYWRVSGLIGSISVLRWTSMPAFFSSRSYHSSSFLSASLKDMAEA